MAGPSAAGHHRRPRRSSTAAYVDTTPVTTASATPAAGVNNHGGHRGRADQADGYGANGVNRDGIASDRRNTRVRSAAESGQFAGTYAGNSGVSLTGEHGNGGHRHVRVQEEVCHPVDPSRADPGCNNRDSARGDQGGTNEVSNSAGTLYGHANRDASGGTLDGRQPYADQSTVPASTIAAPRIAGNAATPMTKVVWRRREQQESASTEGSLRALLNKLAPSSDSLGSLANQVASHLLEDEAPDELARQLVDRAQLETIYAATYAKLCSVLVRVRSGFVFYKQLMTRCQEAFTQGVRTLIAEPMELGDEGDVFANASNSPRGYPTPFSDHRPQHPLYPPLQPQRPQLQQRPFQPVLLSQQPLLYPRQVSSSGSSNGGSYQSNGSTSNPSCNDPSNLDVQRHRLRALVVFLCQLFAEGLLSFDRLYDDYLKLLEVHLPEDDVAVECICSALSCAGQAIERARQPWVLATVRQLQAALRPPHEQRKLRMIFMMQDLVEMHQRNWQPREPMALTSASRMPRDQAEP